MIFRSECHELLRVNVDMYVAVFHDLVPPKNSVLIADNYLSIQDWDIVVIIIFVISEISKLYSA